MKKQVKARTKKPHPLVGAWVNGDEYESDVEYVVGEAAGAFTVRAIDRFDGEEGAVYDVGYDAQSSVLSFSVRFASTGRFLNVRLLAISPNRVSYTYTYTENQMWFRKGAERPREPKPAGIPRRHGRETAPGP